MAVAGGGGETGRQSVIGRGFLERHHLCAWSSSTSTWIVVRRVFKATHGTSIPAGHFVARRLVDRLLGVPFIRQYEPRDREALYEVCLRTGNDGGDATGLYQVPTILGEVYIGPYLRLHPELAWVIDDNGSASGYVLCAPDTTAFESRCEAQWWPALRERYPLGSFPRDSLDEEVVGIIHDPERAATEFLGQFPAHLHIDITPEMQGQSWGTALISTLLDELMVRGVPGVHLSVSTANARAIGFYEHLGFTVLSHDAANTMMGKHIAID